MNHEITIVLGGGIKNNDLPEYVKTRVDKAIQINHKTIVSGKHSPNHPHPITEAHLMENYFKKHSSIPIIKEEESMDTVGNAVFSSQIIIKNPDIQTIHIITSKFHMPRTKKIFHWVFGNKYQLIFHATENTNIDQNILESRLQTESVLLEYLENNIFPNCEAGNINSIYKYITQNYFVYTNKTDPEFEKIKPLINVKALY